VLLLEQLSFIFGQKRENGKVKPIFGRSVIDIDIFDKIWLIIAFYCVMFLQMLMFGVLYFTSHVLSAYFNAMKLLHYLHLQLKLELKKHNSNWNRNWNEITET